MSTKKLPRWLRVILIAISFTAEIISTIVVFIADTIKEFATPMLVVFTALYVVVTFSIVNETKKQTNIMMESSRPIQRPYVGIDMTEVNFKEAYITNKYPVENISGLVKYTLRNSGKTPAFVIFYVAHVDSLSLMQFNIHDSVVCGKITTRKLFEEFPTTFDPGYEYPSGIYFERIMTNSNGNFFAHFYILYTDVFKEYHSAYAITQWVIDTMRVGAFKYPSTIKTYDFTDSDTNNIASLLAEYRESNMVKSMVVE